MLLLKVTSSWHRACEYRVVQIIVSLTKVQLQKRVQCIRVRVVPSPCRQDPHNDLQNHTSKSEPIRPRSPVSNRLLPVTRQSR